MSKKIYAVPAVSGAVRLLTAVAAGEARTVPELVRRGGVSASSVYRIVRTLVACGWIEEDGAGRLLLGRALLGLLSGDPLEGLKTRALPVLEAVRDGCGLTAKLSVREGEEFLMVARAESTRAMSLTAKVGARESLCVGSSGAALLAGLSEEEVEGAVRRAPRAVWKHQTPQQLDARVRDARATGTCLDLGESHPEIGTASCRVALPPFEAALTVIGMAGDFSGAQAARLRALLLRGKRSLEEGVAP